MPRVALSGTPASNKIRKVVLSGTPASASEQNGQFQRSKYGLGATVKRPGYPESYKRWIIQQTGEKYLKPEEQK